MRRLVDRRNYYLNRSSRLSKAREYCNREDVKARRAKYVRDPVNKARRRANQNAAYAKDPEKKKGQVYAYRARNPKANAAATLKWKLKHPEEAKRRAREWVNNNKAKHNESHRQYKIRRRASDPAFKALGNLRRRLNIAVRTAGTTKVATTMSLTGCTPAELMAHLELKFTPGMSWATYGLLGWNIDHIKPCENFDLTDPAQQRECFHFTNLQPMWAVDNLKKRFIAV